MIYSLGSNIMQKRRTQMSYICFFIVFVSYTLSLSKTTVLSLVHGVVKRIAYRLVMGGNNGSQMNPVGLAVIPSAITSTTVNGSQMNSIGLAVTPSAITSTTVSV